MAKKLALFTRSHGMTILVCLVIIVGLFLRMRNFSLPPIDGHPMRQTDTECVAYHFATRNFNPLYPQTCLIRPQTNEAGYFFLEFPAYQYLIALFYKMFGTSITVARLVNLGLYTLSCLALFTFLKQYISKNVAFFSLLCFVFAPSSLFFMGHALHPDIFMMATLTCALYFFSRYKTTQAVKDIVFGSLLFSISVATRPFVLMALPSILIVYLSSLPSTEKNTSFKKTIQALLQPKLLGTIVFISFNSVLLYGLWRYWHLQFNDADHSWENWILFGQEYLKNVEYVWHVLIKKNITGEVVGKVISIFSLFGLASILYKRSKISLFILPWLLAVPLYWYVAPSGNFFHQYYAHVYVLPLLIAAGVGLAQTHGLVARYSTKTACCIVTTIALLIVYNGYRTSQYFYLDIISSGEQQVAQDIATYIPEDKKVVYLTQSTISFSMVHRQGWRLGASPVDVDPKASEIEKLIQYGAAYVVYPHFGSDFPDDELAILKAKYPVMNGPQHSTIFRLTN